MMTNGSSSKKKPKSTLKSPVVKHEKKPKSTLKSPVVKQEKKPSLKPKKMGSEIDDIFAGKKRKRPENEDKDKPEKPTSKPHEYGRVVKSGKIKDLKERDIFDNNTSRSRKKTADGLTLYTEEELGIGKTEAGGTRLCPFDCDCCF